LTRRRGRPAAAALLAVAAVALVLLAPSASAHAELESSEPAQGARLHMAPEQVVLRLSEPVEPSATTVVVLDTDGRRVDRDDLRIETGPKPVLTLSLHSDLGPGAYAIVWKTLSRTDGHPSGDRIGFAVGAFDPPTASTDPGPPSPLAVGGRALAYAGLALAFGAAAWLWAVRADLDGARTAAQRALLGGAVLHTAGLLLLLKATADATGLAPSALAASQVGRLLAIRLVAGLGALVLAGLALLPRNPSRLGPPLAAALMVVAALGSAAIGHAAAQGLPGMAVDAMHLLASATWVGGLVLLLVALVLASRRGLPVEAVRRIGLRFGTVALGCVVVLFLAGTAASLLILGREALLGPLALTETPYGRFLLAKVGLALLVVALAAANRFVFLDPRSAGGLRGQAAKLGPDGSTRGFRRTVAVEAALGAVVLVLAAFLTAVSPGTQAYGGAPDGPASAVADGALFHFHLELEPPPVVGGRSDLSVMIHDLATGEALANNTCGRDSCVQLTLAPENDPDAGTLYVLVPDGQGHWSVADLLWTFEGPATALVQVETAVAQDSATLSFAVASS
jgi:copper transport protein